MIELSEKQRKVVSLGVTILALVITVAFVAVVALGLLKLLALTSTAFVPVILGFFLALFFKPYYLWWKHLVKNPTLALVIMLATVFVPLGLLIWYAGSVLVDQISNLIAQGPQLVHDVTVWFQSTFPKLHGLLVKMGVPYQDAGLLYTKYGATAIHAGTSALKCVAGVFSFLLAIIFFVFFIMTKDRKGSEILSAMPFLKPDTRSFLATQIDTFFEILVSFFQRQTIICLIEGVYYGLGFMLVGLPYGFLIGFALGVLNLVPLLGSVVCLPVALPLAYFVQGGSVTRLVLVLVVWLVGQFLDGYFITPKIQGNKTGLGYAGVIFSFIFWAALLGPMLGMLLAIPLSAFCVVLWRAVCRRIVSTDED